MPGLLDALKTKLGVRGKRRYESVPVTPPFDGLNLKEKLQALVLDIRVRDRDARRKRNATHYLLALYYQGYQRLQLNDSGTFFDVLEDDDNFHTENQFRRHVDTVVQILNRNEGDVLCRPASDRPADISTARVSDAILEYSRSVIGYDRIRDLKGLYKCLFGNAFVFTDYITDKKYGTIVTPKFSYEERPDVEGGDPILSKVVNGYESRNKGTEIAAVCSPLETNCTSSVKEFESLPYFQWISRQDVDTLNYLYPGLGAQATSDISEDLAQHYLDILGDLTGSIGRDSVYNYGETTKGELTRTWIQPQAFKGDKELLGEFKEGVHVTGVNGRLVDYYEEDYRDRWTHEVLIPSPHSLFGDGLYDAVLKQDTINEVLTLIVKHLRYSTVGHKVYDTQMIDAKDVINDPENGWIPGKSSIDKNIGQAVKELPPSQLSGDVGAMLTDARSAMADMTSAHDPVTGKSSGANTPYSQSVFLNERAQSRWQGSINYNKPELIRFHRQLLRSAQRNWVDARSRAIQDNTGNWSFQQFAQADMQGDVDILITNTDMKPKGRAEQIQGIQMYGTMQPMIAQLPPRQKLRIDEMFGLPPDANPMSNQFNRANRIIDRLKKGETVTPLPLVDDGMAQLPVFRDFLVSEEGEALAEKDPQIYANVYTYMLTLLQMSLGEQSSPAAGMMSGGPQMPPPSAGAPQPKEKQQPGGQLGQKGGGPGSAEQPEAQTPAKPSPPVIPPSA